jgi:multicomponent Na+:H+ antiporter subunit E
MHAFLMNLLLAIVWRAATGHGGLAHLVLGFVVGYVVLWWLQPVLGPSAYFRKLPQIIRFTGFFVWELLVSNLRVAWDVVTPQVFRRPGIIAVPLDAKTDFEITLLAGLLTLTPGSLSVDVSSDRTVMYVHCMFIDDPERMRRAIKDGFERRVLELLR